LGEGGISPSLRESGGAGLLSPAVGSRAGRRRRTPGAPPMGRVSFTASAPVLFAPLVLASFCSSGLQCFARRCLLSVPPALISGFVVLLPLLRSGFGYL